MDAKKSSAHLIAVADTLYLVSIALARPGTVGGTRWSGVKISSFSCLTYTTILLSRGGTTFRLTSWPPSPTPPLLVLRMETGVPLLAAPGGAEPPPAMAGCCSPARRHVRREDRGQRTLIITKYCGLALLAGSGSVQHRHLAQVHHGIELRSLLTLQIRKV